MIHLRRGAIEDLADLQNIFVTSVMQTCAADYTPEQINVWVSSIEDTARWHQILTQQLVWVATWSEHLVGFATLNQGYHIDLLYVHPNFQRKGVAGVLLSAIESFAIQSGQKVIHSEVSITARSFFEKNKFEIQCEQIVYRQDIGLKNYKMIKNL